MNRIVINIIFLALIFPSQSNVGTTAAQFLGIGVGSRAMSMGGAFTSMVNGGSFVEEIAEALGKSVNSIRGKALSLLRSGDINAIPKQKETKGSSKADPLADIENIGDLSVEDIADEISKTVRGVKTMLTRRGLTCADYDGAARKEKASS